MDRDDASKGRRERHGSMCGAARRRHGDVSRSSGSERSFDIQLIRDRNRDSSERAARFETDSGRGSSRMSMRLACVFTCANASRYAVASPSIMIIIRVMKEKILFI